MTVSSFPSSLPVLLRQYGDASRFYAWAAELRWEKGFLCPKCGHTTCREHSAGLRRCSACSARVSALAGTALGEYRGSHDALLLAGWSLAEQGTMSASRLARDADVSYGSAFLTLRKIRTGLLHAQNTHTPFLDGDVEVDETFIGGSKANTNRRGRSPMPAKHLVFCAVERGPAGKSVMRRADHATKTALHSFITTYVHSSSRLHTDGYAGYQGISANGYTHLPVNIKGSDQEAHEVLPVVHQLISLTKRRMLAAYNRQPGAEHLDEYLAEACYHWNARDQTVPDRFIMLWRDLLTSPLEVRR